jgi:hypothetical protein
VVAKEDFIGWIRGFLENINDFNCEVIETFQNEGRSRVTSLWRVTDKSNEMLNTAPVPATDFVHPYRGVERS